MRAVVYDHTGDADVLHLVDKPVTDPGPGEVRVRIRRSGVNPTDWKTRSGATGPSGPLPQPHSPNQDGAGVVDALGEGVSGVDVGQRVWVWEAAYQRPEGTAQEYALMPARRVVPLPDGASFDLGASLGVPFVTARRALTVNEDGPSALGPGTLDGRVVLVAGGAGAVGNAAIQLARWSDATVITTVSSAAKAHLARAAGADHGGVNTVVEVAPAANAGIDAAVLAPHGTVAIYANDGGQELTLPVRPLMTVNARWQFVLMYTAPPAAMAAGVDDLTRALADGALRVGEDAGLPLHHFPLERTADAHRAVEGSVVGKVLIDVSE